MTQTSDRSRADSHGSLPPTGLRVHKEGQGYDWYGTSGDLTGPHSGSPQNGMRMARKRNLSKYLVLSVILGGAGLAAWKAMAPSPVEGVPVPVRVNELSPAAAEGKTAFDAVCAACHGQNAAGTEKGPPLIHDVYNPGHHSDEAFLLAVQLGVRQHHWPFGNMPPQPAVSRDQVESIVRYVRELQLANGIAYGPHQM